MKIKLSVILADTIQIISTENDFEFSWELNYFDKK